MNAKQPMDNMSEKIKKLISNYEKQIAEYDRRLAIIKETERSVEDPVEREDLFVQRQVLNSQRQRTVQFVSDLRFL